MQQCGSDDSGEIDYGDLFEVKNGASNKTDCESGTVCCVPKPKVTEIVCTSMENYQCLPSDVSKFCYIFLINC